jgi:hypothetical protein
MASPRNLISLDNLTGRRTLVHVIIDCVAARRREKSEDAGSEGERIRRFRGANSMQRTRERHYEIEDYLSYLGVAHGGESAAQLKAFAHEVGDFGFAVWPERNRSCRRSGASILQEVAGRDAEKIGDLLQATGEVDPIRGTTDRWN